MPSVRNSILNRVVPIGDSPGKLAAWEVPGRVASSSEMLHRTWAFRLAMLTWVASVTKSVETALHGLVGILPLFALAVAVSLFEGSIVAILQNVHRNARRNWLMVLLVLWYGFGVFCKMYLWGATETDWRLVMGAVMLIIALLMGLGFMHEESCVRSLQIGLIVGIGLQSLFTGLVMTEDPTLSRQAVWETSGGWALGDQGGFALESMLLPVLVWRALVEKGALRFALITGCAAISFAVTVCNFQTAIFLLALSIPTAVLISLTFVRHQFFRMLTVALCLLVFGACAVLLLRNAPFMAPTVGKLKYFLQDPTSGGYSKHDAETGSRWMLAEISWASFCQEPLFGCGSGSIRYSDETVGGHSSLFDMLGFYGLLGGGGAFITLVLLLSIRALQGLQNLRNWSAAVVATCLVLFIIAGIVNPYWESSIAIILLAVPLFCGRELRI